MNGLSDEIYETLLKLGVTSNYTGFFQAAYAIQICVERPERLLLVSKWFTLMLRSAVIQVGLQ